MRVQLEEVSKNYDRAAWWYDMLADLFFDWILHVEKYRERTVSLLGDLRGATVLDIGCGTGRSIEGLTLDEAWKNRIEGLIDGEVQINVISKGDFIRSNLTTLSQVCSPVARQTLEIVFPDSVAPRSVESVQAQFEPEFTTTKDGHY
jgi:SAM-dependent methyltransferase